MWIYADWLFVLLLLWGAFCIALIGYEIGRLSRPSHGGGGWNDGDEPIIPDTVPDEWVDETV